MTTRQKLGQIAAITLHAEQFFPLLVSELHFIALLLVFELLFSDAASEIVFFSLEALSVA